MTMLTTGNGDVVEAHDFVFGEAAPFPNSSNHAASKARSLTGGGTDHYTTTRARPGGITSPGIPIFVTLLAALSVCPDDMCDVAPGFHVTQCNCSEQM